MAKKKVKVPEKYEKAYFPVDAKRYKSNFVYRFTVNAKMLVEKLPSWVYILSIVGGFSIYANVVEKSPEWWFGLAICSFGFFGLIFHWSDPNSKYTVKDLDNSIRFHAWKNNQCWHCWKKVSKAASRCPHCTSDISSIF